VVQGAYFDGLKARSHAVELSVEDGVLHGTTEEGPAFAWLIAAIRLIDHGAERVRLGAPDDGVERLVVPREGWEALSGQPAGALPATERRREWRLIGALTAAGVIAALAVFVGIPAAAGPLAQITPPGVEQAMGANMERQLKVILRPCEGSALGARRLGELGRDLAAASHTPVPIRVEAVRAPMVNAFALPGGVVLVTDEMIALARTPDELAGVLAHEIAHVEKRHAMHAAWRSMGVGLVLDALVGGGTGAGQQAVLLAGGLTEQRFSRELEKEADARAVELLAAREISTAGMADLFGRMADRKSDERLRKMAEWFATHPDTLHRSQTLRASARPGAPAMSPEHWRELKQVCAQA
jgi:predicted Zn-dependent protease